MSSHERLFQLLQGLLRVVVAHGTLLEGELAIFNHAFERVHAEVSLVLAYLIQTLVVIAAHLAQMAYSVARLALQNGAFSRIKLSEEPTHQFVVLGIVLAVLHLFFDLLLALLLTLTKSVLQEVLCPSLLRYMLLQDVLYQISVPLV